MKKILKIMCVTIMLFTITHPMYLSAESSNESEVLQISQAVAIQYLSIDPQLEMSCDSGIPVYSVQGDLQGAFFNLYKNGIKSGYVIVFSISKF